MNNKIKAMLGFAVKSGKIVFGLDNLLETRKNIKLVVCSPTTSENNKEKLKMLCEYKKWKLVETSEKLEDLIHRDNCKIVGLIDGGMSSEILKLENIKVITRE